jgi:hypothetical protein
MVRWLLKADKGADLLSRWFLVYTVMTGAYAWLAKHVSFFSGLNWAELIFVGLISSLVTILVIAASLAFFRYWRPLNTNPPLDLDHTEGDQLRSQVELLETRLDTQISGELHAIRQKQTAIIDDYQRMRALEDRFEETSADIFKQLGALNAHRSLDADDIASRFGRIHDALAAIFHREMLHKLEEDLKVEATDLCRPTDEHRSYDFDAWEQWESTEAAWRGTLAQYCDIAECYKPGVKAFILATPESAYKQGWSVKDEQFPDSTAVYAYKTFRILLNNFKDWRDEIERAVHQAAFAGGSVGTRPAVRSALQSYDAQGPG